MKRLKSHEFPEVLTEEIIEILVAMAKEFPKGTFDWAEISLEAVQGMTKLAQ